MSPASQRLRPKFSIANLILLTVAASMGTAWWLEKREHASTRAILYSQRKETEQADRKLNSVYQRLTRSRAELPYLQVRAAVGDDFELKDRYRNAGHFQAALDIFERTAEAQAKYHGPNDPATYHSVYRVGELYNLIGRPDDAEPHLERYVDFARQSPGINRVNLSIALSHLGGIRRWQHRYFEAEQLLSESVAIKEEIRPDQWDTFNAKSGLGEALVGQRKFADAEPLLTAGYEGLLERETHIWRVLRATRMARAAERLVRLYEEWGKPDEAAKWRAELERIEAKYAKDFKQQELVTSAPD